MKHFFLILLGAAGVAYWQRKRIALYLARKTYDTAVSAGSSATNAFISTFSV